MLNRLHKIIRPTQANSEKSSVTTSISNLKTSHFDWLYKYASIANTTQANYQDSLKTMAMITMIIDHIGVYFYPKQPLLRIIGRTAMPVFCFFAGYNYKNQPKWNILFVGLLMFIFSIFIIQHSASANILITIFIGQCYITCLQQHLKSFSMAFWQVLILILATYFTQNQFEYGTAAIAIMVLGYIAQHDKKTLKDTVIITLMITFCHSLIFNFSNKLCILTALLLTFQYIVMLRYPFEKMVKINTRWISRNALYIYALHLSIIQLL